MRPLSFIVTVSAEFKIERDVKQVSPHQPQIKLAFRHSGTEVTIAFAHFLQSNKINQHPNRNM